MRPIILIVEDDADLQKMLGLVLEQAGYEVITAESGQQALVYAEMSPVALIILDIMLAGYLDGQQVLSRLKGNPVTAPIPVIATSAYRDDERIQELLVEGAESFVLQPYEPRELLRIVADILTGPGEPPLV